MSMPMTISECRTEFTRVPDELETKQQELVDNNFSCNETNIYQSIDTIQPDRQLRIVLRQKVISTVIKIIIFTDTILSSLLPKFLSTFFASINIDATEHHNENSFRQNIVTDDSITYFVIIKSTRNVKTLVDYAHSHNNVHSIYLQCESNQLKYQRRLARNYSKLNAVLDDSLRLLITVIMDVALFCEEMADRQKDNPSLTKTTEDNYQRSMDLYTLAEKLIL